MPIHPHYLTDANRIQTDISEILDIPLEDVRECWRSEIQQLGINVCRDAKRFGVTPHVYDESMQALYERGHGFIFETLVYWQEPHRQAWSIAAAERIEDMCRESGKARSDLRILILGDGAGSDTLYLTSLGFNPVYFDVPGSVSAHFAQERLQRYTKSPKYISDFEQLLGGNFDIVWSFEVLEHLPDLPQAVADLSDMVGPKGRLLLTESCEHVTAQLPTHLAINQKYAPLIPSLFHDNGMLLTWTRKKVDYRPCEYKHLQACSLRDRFHSTYMGTRFSKKRMRSTPK